MSSYERPPQQSGAVTAVGVLSIIYGVLYVLAGAVLVFMGSWLLTQLGLVDKVADEAARQAPGDERLKQEATGMVAMILSWIYVCGGLCALYGLFPILGGIAVIKRTGKTMTFVFAILALVWGVLSVLGKDFIGAAIQFGFGITSLIILSKFSHEFETVRPRPHQ